MTAALELPIVPTNDRVIVRRLIGEAQTEGGLHVPEQAQKPSWIAEVVAVGPGRRRKNSAERIAPGVAVGDQVALSAFTGVEFDYDWDRYACVRESEIMAVVG